MPVRDPLWRRRHSVGASHSPSATRQLSYSGLRGKAPDLRSGTTASESRPEALSANAPSRLIGIDEALRTRAKQARRADAGRATPEGVDSRYRMR